MRVTSDIQHLIEKRFNSYKHFDPGEHIYSEGELFENVYYIVGGKVKIVKSGLNKQMTMRFCEAKEFIGIIPFFDHSKLHSTTALVSRPGADLIRISKKDFVDFIGRHNGIQKEIANELCKMISLTEMRIANTSERDRIRFVNTVAFLAEREHERKILQTNKEIIVKYSEEFVSELSMLSIKNLERILSEFESNKLLKIVDNNLVIHNFGEFLASR